MQFHNHERANNMHKKRCFLRFLGDFHFLKPSTASHFNIASYLLVNHWGPRLNACLPLLRRRPTTTLAPQAHHQTALAPQAHYHTTFAPHVRRRPITIPHLRRRPTARPHWRRRPINYHTALAPQAHSHTALALAPHQAHHQTARAFAFLSSVFW